MTLLDTHIWLDWIVLGPDALPRKIWSVMQEGDLAVSAISCFEVEMLSKKGVVDLEMPANEWLQHALAPSGVRCLPIHCEIAALSVRLSPIHKDPADRLIIATAVCEGARLASKDRLFPLYPELNGRLVTEKP